MKTRQGFILGWIFWLLLASVSSLQAKTGPIFRFDGLMQALKSGKAIKVIIYYGRCVMTDAAGKTSPAPDAMGGLEIRNFEYFARNALHNEKAFVVASESQLITHSRYGMVFNYVKVRMEEDGSVKITARYINPKTFAVEMDETFQTQISGEKDRNGGFYLFKVD